MKKCCALTVLVLCLGVDSGLHAFDVHYVGVIDKFVELGRE